jgi:tetratricopeptide (TPR) repeat protein
VLVTRLERGRQYHELLTAGERALRGGNGYLAIEALSGALVLRQDSMVAYYRRGMAYRAQGHDREAIRDWKDAHALAPDAPEPLVALAELYEARDQPALAAAHYEDAADLLKDEDPALLYSLALARYRSGSPAAAVDPLRRATARNEALAPAHYLLGLVQRDIGETDAALASLDRAIQLDRKLVAAHEELADLYRSLGRHGEAVLQLQALSALDPQIDRRIAVALAQARQGAYPQAFAGLATLAAEAPGDSRVDLARARVHLAHAEATGDRASARVARDALELALGGTVSRSEGLALFGRALHLSGEFEEAERILREAVATSPADPPAFAYLADSAEQLAHPLVARDALLNLNALQGSTISRAERADRARRIGRLSLLGGDADTAAGQLQRAIDDGHADASTIAWLAEARWTLGDRDAARALLARARGADAHNADVLRLARIVR